jgi:hypothetical protein
MSDHKGKAEDLLEHASHVHGEQRMQALAAAQVHATLALTDAQVSLAVDPEHALESQTEFLRRTTRS